MMRMRWLAVIVTVIGLFLGMAFPRVALGDLTGYQLAAAMAPPTETSGTSAELNCGWHSDSTGCVSPYTFGYALDWEDKKADRGSYNNPWYFRGFFYTSASTNRRIATGIPLVSQSSPDYCDMMTVWIAEYHSGQLRGIPVYYHVNITNSTSFAITGGPWTVYQNRLIGRTINDTGSSCGFGGSHVHESDVPYRTDIVTTTRNTGLYPTAQQCHTAPCNPTYGPYVNNNINNWTRRFAWAEGAP
jgi:hypothetical protein